MIIVTGEPRSGTSLMMDTLRLFGFPIWGSEQPGEEHREGLRQKEVEAGNRESAEPTLEEKVKAERATEMNERFWEVGGLVMKGIQVQNIKKNRQNLLSPQHKLLPEEEKNRQLKIYDTYIEEYEKHKDAAVKIIWNGLIRTDYDILKESKIILCLRHPLHIAKSQTNLQGIHQIAEEIDGQEVFVSGKQPFSPMRYLRNSTQFVQWLQVPINQKLSILRIDYDDMYFESEASIKKIVDFLEIDVSPEKIKETIENIDPNRRRSAVTKDNLPNEDQEEWILVGEIYDALRRNDDLEVIQTMLEDYQERKRNDPENARWLDEETFFPMTPSLYRSMQKKPAMKQQMVQIKRNRKAGRIICPCCPNFNSDGQPYTITTPFDMPDIERNKVRCEDLGEVSLERCQHHWEQIRYDFDKWKKYVELKEYKKSQPD